MGNKLHSKTCLTKNSICIPRICIPMGNKLHSKFASKQSGSQASFCSKIEIVDPLRVHGAVDRQKRFCLYFCTLICAIPERLEGLNLVTRFSVIERYFDVIIRTLEVQCSELELCHACIDLMSGGAVMLNSTDIKPSDRQLRKIKKQEAQ